MPWQFVSLHGWLLPPYPVGRYAGARARLLESSFPTSTEAAPTVSLSADIAIFGAGDYS
jgi:hypothetical protein